jgi:hypothetical protein
MSLRIGLYDFFSYTLPGALFIVLAAMGLAAFNVIDIDATILNEFSLAATAVLVGGGYLIGYLLNPLAEKWGNLFIGSHERDRDAAYADFHERHPTIKMPFAVNEWQMLIHAIKAKSVETATDVEQHNVISIMMLNLSLILAGGTVLFVSLLSKTLLNLIVAIVMALLTISALHLSQHRRRWFFKGIFEAFAAYYLLEEKIKNPQAPSPTENVPTVASMAANDA